MNKRPNGFDRWGVSFIGLEELNCSFVLSLNVNLIRLESNKSNRFEDRKTFASALAKSYRRKGMAGEEFRPSEEYIDTVKNMNALHAFFNKLYFNGELITPVITVRQDMRGRAYGWFVPNKVWTAEEDGYAGSVEINMCSQWLNRPFEEVAGTMLHEMCHQYAYVKGIKDTSRYGYYHNKEFKSIAEKHGLKVENTGRHHGWCKTELTEESKRHLKNFVQNGRILYDIRICHEPSWFGSGDSELKPTRQRKPSSTRKLICLNCGMSVRATKDVYVICGKCKTRLMPVLIKADYDPAQDKSWVEVAAEPKFH